MDANSWNFKTEKAKSSFIQGRVFGEAAETTIPDAYGHIANYDALVNFSADFVGNPMGDIEGGPAGMYDDLTQSQMAIRTSGRGYEALDMAVSFYGKDNEYNGRGFKMAALHRSVVAAGGLPEGAPYVPSDLVHLPQYENSGSAPPLPVANGAFDRSATLPVSGPSMRMGTYARSDMLHSVRRPPVDGLDSIAASFYAAEARAAMMERTLFVERASTD
jgi:hypothetical protein